MPDDQVLTLETLGLTSVPGIHSEVQINHCCIEWWTESHGVREEKQHPVGMGDLRILVLVMALGQLLICAG